MADACTTRSMMRREIEVTSVSGLVEAIEKLQHSAPHPTTFRGQRDDSPLLPVLTRKGGPAEDLPLERVLAVERKLVDEYRRRLSGVLGRSPTSWETVVIGRHNGLATRLLDWSESPAVALYFATAGEAAVDEAVAELRDRNTRRAEVFEGDRRSRIAARALEGTVGSRCTSWTGLLSAGSRNRASFSAEIGFLLLG
jgi:FRG domain